MQASAAIPETGNDGVTKTQGTVETKSSDPSEVGTEATGDGGTPDLPLPEPRSQPEEDPTGAATTVATASALENAAQKAPAATLADVLGKRSTPSTTVPLAGPKSKPAKSHKKAKATAGPGIASFFGGGNAGVDNNLHESDDHEGAGSPSASTEGDAENAEAGANAAARSEQCRRAAEQEAGLGFCAAIAASKVDEDTRRRGAEAAMAAKETETEAETTQTKAPPSAPPVAADKAKQTHPLLLAAARKKTSLEKAACDKAAADTAAVANAAAEKAGKAAAAAKAAADRAAVKTAKEHEKSLKAETALAEKAAKAREKLVKAEKASADKAAKITKAAADTAERERSAAVLAKTAAQTECDAETEAAARADAIAKVEARLRFETAQSKPTFDSVSNEPTVATTTETAKETKGTKESGNTKNPFFMTAEERKRVSVAAETAAKDAKDAAAAAALKTEIECVKKVDAELSAGRKPHHFFAMQREKTASVKEGSSKPFLQGGYFEPKPAPLEKAGPPKHVARAGDTQVERDNRNLLAAKMGPLRRVVEASLASRLNCGTSLLEDVEFDKVLCTTTPTPPAIDPTETEFDTHEEREDAMLTDTAKFVLASRGEWNAAAVVSGALARTRGELRRQLISIRTRGVVPRGDDATRGRPAVNAGALWVDLYKPHATGDCVGDPNAASHVRDWLRAWQTQIASEAFGGVGGGAGDGAKNKACKKQPPKKKQKRDSSDEDWDPNDDGDGDDDDGVATDLSRGGYVPLVNKKGVPASGALVCGPVGCGKTAAVYAAARELGFTVLEVNASSKRSGAEILTQFGEATQSRRFRNGGDGIGGGKKQTNSGAGGLFGLFGVATQEKKPGVTSGTKRHMETDPVGDPTYDKSNTLILFEEVDVLRGEDRGFMAALASLIQTTKRPIVLTSNTNALPGLVGSVAETVAGVTASGLPLGRIKFKAPSAADAAAYACLVSVVEGKPVPCAAVALAAACDSPNETGKHPGGGDVRRALHAAHFLSFGRCSSHERVSKSKSTSTCASLGFVVAQLVAESEGCALVLAEASAPLAAAAHVRKTKRASQRKDAKAAAAVEAGAMRRALDAIAKAEQAKQDRRVKNVEDKRKLLGGTKGRAKGGLLLTRSDPETLTADQLKRHDEAGSSAAATGVDLVGAQTQMDTSEDGNQSDATVSADEGEETDTEELVSKPTAMDVDATTELEPEKEKEESPGCTGDEFRDDVDDDASLDSLETSKMPPPPSDHWARALAEMARLAYLADAFSAADAMARPAAVGASGPSSSPFGHAQVDDFLGDDDGAFDGAKAETRGGCDLVGEPRATLGGGFDLVRACAGVIHRHALALAPRPPAVGDGAGDAVNPPITTTAPTPTPTPTELKCVTSRLKELAECTGIAVLRGTRGGGGFGGAGEAAERVGYLARMAVVQAVNKQLAKTRRRRPVRYVPVSSDALAELEAVGTFSWDE